MPNWQSGKLIVLLHILPTLRVPKYQSELHNALRYLSQKIHIKCGNLHLLLGIISHSWEIGPSKDNNDT